MKHKDLKVGMKVRVRPDLELGKSYGGMKTNPDGAMGNYGNRIFIIEDLYSNTKLALEDTDWVWTAEMLIPINDKMQKLKEKMLE